MSETAKVNPEQRMLIDGKLVDADSGKTFDNVNPATEEVIGQVADASNAEMHRAIDAARRAFDETDWSTNPAFRKQCLEQLQDGRSGSRRSCVSSSSSRSGCPRMTTNGPQLDAPDAEGHHAGRPSPSTSSSGRPCCPTPWASRGRSTRGASGMSRSAWSAPSCRGTSRSRSRSNKLGQALATGNTVVLKPAPDTPWNATLVGRVVAEKTDIPAGVVNVVTSSDHLVGEELTLSPKVDLISFTGSTAVGKRIMEKGRPR